MNDCRHFEELLAGLFADELDRADRERLEAHLETCASCRELSDLHERLAGAEIDLAVPDRSELATLRWSVLGQISRQPTRRRPRSIFAAAAAAVFLLGLGLGRALPRDETARLLDRVGQQQGLDDDAWRLSSVELESVEDGQVELFFELSRPLEVTRPADDPFVVRAVAEAVGGGAELGDRIRAVHKAGRLAENRAIRRTLLVALVDDPSVAVRLQVLNLLAPWSSESDVRSALLRTVEEDEAVPVRLLALELLGDLPETAGDEASEDPTIGL